MSFTYPWIPDRNDGTYTNLVLHADYSHPDVIRHGHDFYLIASSFHCTPVARVPIGASQVRFFAEIYVKAQVKFGYARMDQACLWFADLFQALAGGWIGARIGIFSWNPQRAPAGRAFFNYFRFAPRSHANNRN